LPNTGIVNDFRTHCRRLKCYLARESFKLTGVSSRWQLGASISELTRAAGETDASYYIVHLEQAVWVGARLLRSGHRVGVDMEDWYSEDLLPEARIGRPVALLRELERELLTGCGHSTAPSHVMSMALSREYGVKPPLTIYNVPRWTERQSLDGLRMDRKNRYLRSIHWFSQTLGAGRGLEELLGALPLMNQSAEIHLRGDPAPGFEEWLRKHVPPNWRDRIYIHPLVSNDELLSRVAEHDIGFAGEMTFCRSRDLTITNKILYYLMAGLAVVASDTYGQREVAECAPGAVSLYPSGDPVALAARLDKFIESEILLRSAKSAALSAAERTLCWERQEASFVAAIMNALETTMDVGRHD
jgi:glycosyltransferase involved in cell wall biosynthesis